MRLDHAPTSVDAARLGAAARACSARARSPRRRRRGCPAACTPGAATGPRSRTTTTCPTSSTSSCSTRRWPTRAATGRRDGRARLRPGRRPARQAGPDLPQARPAARGCGCSTSAAAGRRCSIHAAQHYGVHGGRGDALRRSSARSASRRVAALGPDRPGRDPAAGLPGDRRTEPVDAVRRDRLDRDGRARRPGQLPGLRRPAAPAAAPAGPAAAAADVARGGRGTTPRRAAARSWSATSPRTCTCARSAPR